MKKIRQIIALILCFCIAYTGLGFAEIHYSCAKCINQTPGFAGMFFPTRFISNNYAQCECGCSNENVSCTCGGKPMTGQQNKGQTGNTNHNSCISVSINKKDVSNDFSSVDIPQATSFTLITPLCEAIINAYYDVERPPVEAFAFPSLHPTPRFYLSLHCTFLI